MFLKICVCGFPFQSQSVEPEPFPQDPSMMIDQKPPMYTQQFGPPPSHIAQRGYPGAAMQEQGFHPMPGQMGPRPGYPMMRMQARPGLRPTGVVPNQPNTLRLQLQHRLQSQQVHVHLTLLEEKLSIDSFLFLTQPHCLIRSCVIELCNYPWCWHFGRTSVQTRNTLDI